MDSVQVGKSQKAAELRQVIVLYQGSPDEDGSYMYLMTMPAQQTQG